METDSGHGNGQQKQKYPSNYHTVQCCATVFI